MPHKPEDLISKEDPCNLFELIEELAVGSFGAVYKGRYLPTGELVAVKICAREDDEAFQDLLQEIYILKKLEHPNCIKFFGAYQKGEELYIAMELAEGGAVSTIFEVLEHGLSEQEIAYVVNQTLRGLLYMHEKLLIHRDIKAPNVLMTSDARIKLADFGVSAQLQSKDERRNTFVGTPWWMAPEIILGAQDFNWSYDFKVDVWAVGIMCIELAEGKPPLADMQPMDVLYEIPKNDPPTLTSSGWSSQFVDFIAKCLQKDLDSRPSVTELLEHPFVKGCEDSSVLKPSLEKVGVITSEYASKAEPGETDDSQATDSSAEEEEEVDVGFRTKTALAGTVKRYQPKTQKEQKSQAERMLAQKLMQLQLRALKRQQKVQKQAREEEGAKFVLDLEKIVKKNQKKHDDLVRENKKNEEAFVKKGYTSLQELQDFKTKEVGILTKSHQKELRDLQANLTKQQKNEVKELEDSLKKENKDRLKGKSKDETKKIQNDIKDETNSMTIQLEQQHARQHLDQNHGLARQHTRALTSVGLHHLTEKHDQTIKNIKAKHYLQEENLKAVFDSDLSSLKAEKDLRLKQQASHKQLVLQQIQQLHDLEQEYQQRNTITEQKLQTKEHREKYKKIDKDLSKKEAKKVDKKNKKDGKEGKDKRLQIIQTADLLFNHKIQTEKLKKEVQLQIHQKENLRAKEDSLNLEDQALEKEQLERQNALEIEFFKNLQALYKEQQQELERTELQQQKEHLQFLQKSQQDFMNLITSQHREYKDLLDQQLKQLATITHPNLRLNGKDEATKMLEKLASVQADEIQKFSETHQQQHYNALEKHEEANRNRKEETKKKLTSLHEKKLEAVQRQQREASDLLAKTIKLQSEFQKESHTILEDQMKISHERLEKTLADQQKQQSDLLKQQTHTMVFLKHDPVSQSEMSSEQHKNHKAQKKELKDRITQERERTKKNIDRDVNKLKAKHTKMEETLKAENEKQLQQLKDEEVTLLLEMS